jgi:hypothetical protein
MAGGLLPNVEGGYLRFGGNYSRSADIILASGLVIPPS